jgi:hypothetical protein
MGCAGVVSVILRYILAGAKREGRHSHRALFLTAPEDVLQFSLQHLRIAANVEVPCAELFPIVDGRNPAARGVVLRLVLIVFLALYLQK